MNDLKQKLLATAAKPFPQAYEPMAYLQGRYDENARLTPLLTALIDCAEALKFMNCGKTNMFNVSCAHSGEPHCYRCTSLATLKRAADKK